MSDNTQPRIIGLAGTFASGKDTVAHFLKDNYNFFHTSLGDMIRQVAQKTRGSTERPVLFEVANELRRTRGAGVLVELALQEFNVDSKAYAGVIISGIRSLGEANALKKAGGRLIFVDAPAEIRYQRMIGRHRDTETQLTLQEFKAQEAKELQAPAGDDTAINILGVKALADDIIINDADLESYLTKIRQTLHL